MSRVLALALAVMLGSGGAAAAEDRAPLAGLAAGFYQAVLALPGGGIPDAGAQRTLLPYISPALARLLAAGARAEAAYAAASRLQAPPLLEGDIFTSLFEGATAFRIEGCEIVSGRGRCAVALSYAAPGEKPQHWHDTAMFAQTAQGWRIDDIDYGGNWPFANKGTLKGNLAFAIHNARGGDQDQ